MLNWNDSRYNYSEQTEASVIALRSAARQHIAGTALTVRILWQEIIAALVHLVLVIAGLLVLDFFVHLALAHAQLEAHHVIAVIDISFAARTIVVGLDLIPGNQIFEQGLRGTEAPSLFHTDLSRSAASREAFAAITNASL